MYCNSFLGKGESMKKLILRLALSLGMLLPTISTSVVRADSDAALGALGGLAIGTMIGSATSNRGRSSHAEAEARRAQDQTEQLRQEQQLRRDLGMQQKTSSTMIILISLIVLLFLSVVGLGVMILKKR